MDESQLGKLTFFPQVNQLQKTFFDFTSIQIGLSWVVADLRLKTILPRQQASGFFRAVSSRLSAPEGWRSGSGIIYCLAKTADFFPFPAHEDRGRRKNFLLINQWKLHNPPFPFLIKQIITSFFKSSGHIGSLFDRIKNFCLKKMWSRSPSKSFTWKFCCQFLSRIFA